VVTKIPVGGRPLGNAYDSVKDEIYVANSGDNTVSVISDQSNSVITTITVGTAPRGLAYDSSRGQIYVSNYQSDSISVISDSTNSVVSTFDIEADKTAPAALAYDSGKDELFVTNFFTSSKNDVYFVGNTVMVCSISSSGAVPELSIMWVLTIASIASMVILLRHRKTS
jgi:YVTN family beta-propeller protein